MTVNREDLNTTLAAASLVVSIVGLLITVMGVLAGLIVAVFISGLTTGVLITRYVSARHQT